MITKIDNVMGGVACIAGTRIPVWLLVFYRISGMSFREILAAYPTINTKQLQAARQYGVLHSEEITQDIIDNQLIEY